MATAPREQRFVFGEVAERYDRFRTSIPDVIVDEIARASALSRHSKVLELGSGTGKLTVALAAFRCAIVALEPSEEMARVLRRNSERYPAVTVEVSTFESASVKGRDFDLVVAAHSWHWLDPETRVERSADALRMGGSLAIAWNVADPDAMEFHDELDAVYLRNAPQLAHSAQESMWRHAADPSEALGASGRFSAVERTEHRWSRVVSTADYLGLLSTHSPHRMLDADVRARLHDEIGAIVDAHGGEIEECYETKLFVSRRIA